MHIFGTYSDLPPGSYGKEYEHDCLPESLEHQVLGKHYTQSMDTSSRALFTCNPEAADRPLLFKVCRM